MGLVTVLSGPAGGAQGARLLAQLAATPDVLCFDMGGTSCDVCVIDGGSVRETDARTIAGRPLALPSLDIETVGAGGGSIGWRDAGGALRVGPRSAGADAGPRGLRARRPRADGHRRPPRARAPPVRRAHLGRSAAARERALAAVGRLAAALGIEPLRAAQGIVDVADAEMLGALRTMTVARGIDPRRYALLPFGGAGPLHATAIAAQLGIARILCPRACGVLSALGLAAAAPRRDATGSFEAARVGPLLEQARAQLGGEPAAQRVRYALRYAGQSFELAVDAPRRRRAGRACASASRRRTSARYGYRDAGAPVELVTVTASVWGRRRRSRRARRRARRPPRHAAALARGPRARGGADRRRAGAGRADRRARDLRAARGNAARHAGMARRRRRRRHDRAAAARERRGA